MNLAPSNVTASTAAAGRKPCGASLRFRFTCCLVALSFIVSVFVAAPSNAQDGQAEAAAPAATDPADAENDKTPPQETETTEGFTRYDALLASLTIFVLAVFVGFEVITKVPPTLHTPLMSGSNAISGITIVGALLATGYGGNWFVSLVGTVALILATINVVGGFLVTHRMLEMFKKKK